jgi:internalin A
MVDKHSQGYKEALRLIEENFLSKKILLDLDGLKLTEIPPEIGKLTHLTTLFANHIGVTTLPREIGKLRNLTALFSSNTKVSKLPKEITNLKGLRVLSLNSTSIKEFPEEIIELENLTGLSLTDTAISKLPREILKLKKLNQIFLSRTQLNIPPEIIERDQEPYVILNYYFENVVGADRALNEIKMLLLGEGTVGKTALVNQLAYEKFETTEKTEGIDIHKWNVKIKNNNIQINIWDFAGQEITHATHQFFLTKRSLYLLVLASRADEKANRMEEWLKIIQNLGGESPVIIVCNKSDEHQMNLDERALYEKYPNIREIIKVSSKKGTNIKRLKQIILKEIRQMPHVFDPFSKKWFAVKQRLENLKDNYIPFEDYLKICDEEGVTEDLDRETLIKFLHDLGVVLNFLDDPRVNETSVLKPEWITEGVYKILTSKMLDDAHGVLTLEMVGKILDNRRYPKHKHRFIVQMMEKFERCFPLVQDKTFLVPDLLPKQEPNFNGWKPQETGLGFQYHYEIEPGSFITRFIVNMNEYIDEETYWRKGVVLKNADGNKALVKADLEDKIIFIWIDGKNETRRGFLSMIRRQFDKIHETMSNLKVTEYVKQEKGLINYEDLLDLEKNQIVEHYFPHLKTKVNVRELLNGIETQEERFGKLAEKVRPRLKDSADIDAFYHERKAANYFDSEETKKEIYDVALSFANEDNWYVLRVAQELKANEIKVFFYENEQANLWGENLFDELDDIYRNRSQYVVMFISKHYANKMWTNHERQSAFDRAIRERKAYVLPARFDNTELKGLRSTIAFIDLENITPKDFAQLIIKKLGKNPNASS